MLTEKITEKELSFMEAWHNPICLAESLFSNLDNLSEFKDTFGEIRFYQRPMLSFEPIVDCEMPDLSPKEQFELHKGAGDIYNYGARKFGKSLITEKVDICLSMLHDANCWCGFSSADAIHLQDILDVVTRAMTFHPILKMYKRRFRMSPKYELEGKNGWLLQGINMNIASKDAGRQWFGKHVRKLWVEEASLETDKAYDKRKDSLSEFGAVLRLSGMTNFTRFTPAGLSFYASENKSKILNLPQFVNSSFDDKEDKNRQIEYGGKDSIFYRIFVQGQVCEDGISEFQIDRIEPYINDKIELKSFEIKKDSFPYFKNLIIVERPANADRIFIASDIGDGAGGSEILIFSEVGEKYHYLYRIALYSLPEEEQWQIFDWLIPKLQANVIGFDCGEACGRGLYRKAETKYSKNNLVFYAGTSKVGIDFLKNDNGLVILKDGKPIFVEEFMSDWGVRFLKTLLYNGRILMPTDHKFIKQINSVISHVVGSRTVYDCVASEKGRKDDHVFDAFKVFAMSVWLKKDFNATPKLGSQNGGLGAMNYDQMMLEEKVKLMAEAIEKHQPIECTAEEYHKCVANFINKSYHMAEIKNDTELMKYLNGEIRRLALLFKE